jgi:hypothetical protein
MPVTKKQIISAINEAFKDVTLEDGVGLNEADAIDSYADQQTRATYREKDEKLNWNLISSSTLNHHYSSLSFFDAKGMRFHLPAYLLADIKGEYSFGMTFPLTHLSDYRKSQFELLTPAQRQAIRLYLEYLLVEESDYEAPQIKSAIENYWFE